MNQARSGYRPDIDGLRAVAVLAVLLNHFSRDLLPNGYLGVDIFFVISGFVITGSLTKHEATSFGGFMAGFYARRVRRILPALLVCSLVSAVLICLVNPSPQMILETGAAGIVGFSNIYLWAQSVNYFAPSVDLNIFTHTWSLGVEEQFYLLYPLIFWLLRRQHQRGPSLFGLVLLALSLASLVSFVALKPLHPSSAFFLMPPRFWELGAGGLLYTALQMGSPWPHRLIRGWSATAALAGILLVLVLPSLPALVATALIVVFTLVLIAGPSPGGAAFSLLAAPWMLAIGVGSYSLYLWHWPVLCFSRWTIGLHWWSIPFQLALIGLLAWGSWRWVEQPFRRHPGLLAPRLVLVSGLVAVALAVAGVAGLQRSWFARFYLGRPTSAGPVGGVAQAYAMPTEPVPFCNLFEQSEKALRLDPACGVHLDRARPTLYVLGDSHGWQFLKSLKPFARQHRYNLISVWGNACPFPAGFARGRLPAEDRCYQKQRALESRLLRRVRPGDVVLFASQLNAHFSGQWDMHWRRYSDDINTYSAQSRRLSLDQAAQTFQVRFTSLANRLSARGVRVILYLDPPQFPSFEGGETCSNQWFGPLWLRWECHSDKASHDQRLHRFFAWLEPWRLQDPAQRFLFNVSDLVICPKGSCDAQHFSDSNHLKDYYAQFVWLRFLQTPQGKALSQTMEAF